MKRDRVHLHEIRERLSYLTQAADRDESDLHTDHWFQGGVIRDFEVIGEAGRRVSTQTKQRHHDVPWSEMIGFRNILAHQYDRLDLGRLWSTILHAVPQALQAVERAMEEEGWP